MPNVQLGQGLKKVRNREGITQDELADAIGVTQPYVNQMENGNISLKRFTEVLDGLGYSYEVNIYKSEKVHI